MKIKSLIVDDEKPARELLRQYCSETPFVEVVAECKNAYEAIEKLSLEEIGLVFLDINMPKLNGIQLLRSLKNAPYVIITTAYREYALEGFELDVTDYLKKPFSYERFLKAVLKVKMLYEKINLAEGNLERGADKNTPEYLFLNTDKTIRKIELDKLMYVSAMGDYSHFISENEKHVAYYSLKKLEQVLPSGTFVRVHRSFIISLKHLSHVEGNMVFVGKTEIPIGRSYKEDFLRRLL